jgi:hypothetical protein
MLRRRLKNLQQKAEDFTVARKFLTLPAEG